MRFDTNSSLWLMVDLTVVTKTLEWLCIDKIPMSFVSLYTTPQIHPAILALKERKKKGGGCFLN